MSAPDGQFLTTYFDPRWDSFIATTEPRALRQIGKGDTCLFDLFPGVNYEVRQPGTGVVY